MAEILRIRCKTLSNQSIWSQTLCYCKITPPIPCKIWHASELNWFYPINMKFGFWIQLYETRPSIFFLLTMFNCKWMSTWLIIIYHVQTKNRNINKKKRLCNLHILYTSRVIFAPPLFWKGVGDKPSYTNKLHVFLPVLNFSRDVWILRRKFVKSWIRPLTMGSIYRG